jgi:D-alanyl-D-alanine carboxypeptidase/D-alanyl-D-alanine-endopeptidase (penicillin-binding protein 4)
VAPYHLDVQVKTVAAGQPTTLAVQTFPDGRILVHGEVAVDAGPVVRTGDVLDPAAFARTALIEALGRAGVAVSAPATGPNPVSKLPKNGSYQGDPRVAAYVSPPWREYAKLILKVSHNLGANLAVCLMAVKAGSTKCGQGLAVLAAFLDRTHIDRDQVVLADGRGGDPADRLTPQVVVDLLRYWLGQPEATTFRKLLPLLGVDGSLATLCTNCPSRGKVFAKTGTVGADDPLNNRLSLVKALAGYLEVSPGRFYVFDLVVNGAVGQDFSDLFKVNEDLGTIAALLQQEASR